MSLIVLASCIQAVHARDRGQDLGPERAAVLPLWLEPLRLRGRRVLHHRSHLQRTTADSFEFLCFFALISTVLFVRCPQSGVEFNVGGLTPKFFQVIRLLRILKVRACVSAFVFAVLVQLTLAVAALTLHRCWGGSTAFARLHATWSVQHCVRFAAPARTHRLLARYPFLAAVCRAESGARALRHHVLLLHLRDRRYFLSLRLSQLHVSIPIQLVSLCASSGSPGQILFANVRFTNFLTRNGNFKTFVPSVITLFRMSTGAFVLRVDFQQTFFV